MNPPDAVTGPPGGVGGGARPAARPFEPERTHPAPPDAFDRKLFFDAGIGLLIEQGNVDNARVLLGRRAASHPDDVTVYLDAIRAERTVAPEARAWEAWLERALRHGVDVADEARRLLPSAALQAFLARSELAWKVLQRQPSARDARELLRLRLEGLLLNAPERALDELEHAELSAAAASDPALRELCCATLQACAFSHAARVGVLLSRYAPAAADDPADAAPSAVRARLVLSPAWSAIEAQAPWPKPLARFVALSSVASQHVTRELCAALDRDLRAQPREYLRCADETAARSRALRDALCAQAEALAERAEPACAAGPDTAPSTARAHADAAIARALHALETASPTLASRLADLGGLLLGWPLGHALDRARYRRSARALFAALLVRDGVSIEALAAQLGSAPHRSLRRLARGLQADAALPLLQAWARAAGCPPTD